MNGCFLERVFDHCESADWVGNVGMWKRSNQTGEVFVIILSSFHSSELKRRSDENKAVEENMLKS